MENASKALLMAAEVLISIVIISALVLMFDNLTSYQKVREQNDEEEEVVQFNAKYEAYNREDIRGNDLYSLINKVVDYNERKTTEGQEGKEFNYKPITINVNLKSDSEKGVSEFYAPDGGGARIFKSSSQEFTINATNNTFKEIFKENMKMEVIKNQETLNNLVIGMTKIFIDDEIFEDSYYNDSSQKIAKQVIYNYNSAVGDKAEKLNIDDLFTSWRKIAEDSDIREDVYTYYEYLQFTRAHFKCTGTKYNSGTGRIVEMNFQFTGKIN